MIRVLFSVLAVVVVVLAFVLKQPFLYGVAVILALIVVIQWMAVLRRRHREAVTPYSPTLTPPPAPEEDLQSLGIMEIRPKQASRKPDEPADAPAETASSAAASVVPDPAPMKEFVIEPAATARPNAEPPTNGVEPAASPPHDEAVLGPYLHALRAALGAQTVGVLTQEDLALTYHVLALVSEDGTSAFGTTFSARVPLLMASMAHAPLTVRRVDATDLPHDSLGYRTAPAAVRRVALVPVPRPADAEPCFLLADTPRTDLLDQPRAQALLTQFAHLLNLLLAEAAPAPETEATHAPRPRREIIAEEMEQARAQNQLLALALVYLNRAEAVADAGDDAVSEAEHLLEDRLRETAPHGRVERFGELTYGVFYDGDQAEVEAWGAQIQTALSEETDLLEGGVSIGIAVLHDRHDTPDAFRADATEALREAYETGTCTILA